MPTKVGIRKVTAGKAGHSPGLFFVNALLYKALSPHALNENFENCNDAQPKRFLDRTDLYLFGSSAILIAREYGMGTAIKMGPAYFPTILGGLLVGIGMISVIRSLIVPWYSDRGVRVQGAESGKRVGSCVRVHRARRGIGGCFTVARHHQRSMRARAFVGVRRCSWRRDSQSFVPRVSKRLGIPLPIIGPWFGG